VTRLHAHASVDGEKEGVLLVGISVCLFVACH